MNYRINPKNGDKLSVLGFGCMRFQKNYTETEKQIIHAIENGINYFDTAYLYANSEATLGKVLSQGYREKVKIATKIPSNIKKYEDLDKIFNTQLARLQTNYIDYYLLHMLTSVNVWNRLEGLGFVKWIEEKKKKGQINNIGFSYHGGRSEFPKIVDVFEWDFCMIQFNYLDENSQAGKSGLEYAASKGLPIMIMEPLRGGRLVSGLPDDVRNLISNAYVKRSPAEWAFRWIYNFPQVTTVLSGMNSLQMIEENIRIASDSQPNNFSDVDFKLFEKIRIILNEKIKFPCTGCNYCMPCPSGIDIPTCFSCYNTRTIVSKSRAFMEYLIQTSISNNASGCTNCGICESHCPQQIEIRKGLKEVAKVMEPFYYRPYRYLIKKRMRF